MARYKAKEDIDAGRQKFKAGQEVDVNEIPPGYLGKFELVGNEFDGDAVGDAGEPEDDSRWPVINPDRDALKQSATDLGLTFPANISTSKLIEMINTKVAELNVTDNQ